MIKRTVQEYASYNVLPFSSKNIFHRWLCDNTFEDGMMLHFVSRGRYTDTAGRRGFSFSSNAFHVLLLVPTKSSYQQCVVGTAWALVPIYFQQHLQDGFSVSHRHPAGSSPLQSICTLKERGASCLPAVLSCLPSNSRPALARATHRMSPYFIATHSSTQPESQIAEGSPSQHILSFILFLCPRYSLEFSLLLSR